MDFYINDEYLTDILVTSSYGPNIDHDNPSDDDLIEVLKNPGPSCTITGTEDHPEFAQLRDLLEQQGYIQCQRNWVNGDRVLKSFTLNDVPFEPNEKFCCAAAMKFHIQVRKKYQKKKGGDYA